jgi:hypothetical protein
MSHDNLQDETGFEKDYDNTKSEVLADERFEQAREENRNKITGVRFEGIDYSDSPDFVDSFITYAERGGVPLTEEELDELNEDRETVYELLMNYLY